MPLEPTFFEGFSFAVYRAIVRSAEGGQALSEEMVSLLALLLEFDDARS